MEQQSVQSLVKKIQAILNVNQFSSGNDFFKELVENVAEHLKVKYCFIGRPLEEDNSKVQTCVVWAGSGFVDNFVYDLAGTPCKNILDGKRVGLYSPEVAAQFPEDELLAQMGVESYLGAPIIDHKNNVLGLIVILDDEPIIECDAYSAIMELLAGRVAAEIERGDLQHNLEQQVTERTAELHTRMQELHRTREELIQSEKMASLGRLVAGFAHELNTPLGVAISSLSVLDSKSKNINRLLGEDEIDGDVLDQQLDQLGQANQLINANVKRAAQLVNSFKRTAVDQSVEDIRPFNVKASLSDVITTLHNRFKTTDIQIHLDCADDLTVYSVAGVLDQVLTNFMLNSLEHGFEKEKPTGTIEIEVSLLDQELHLRYKDSGKGIEKKALENIFEPFFTTNRNHGGSGLGLYISYNLICSNLKGQMSCKSQVGHGVQFDLSFPVQFSLPK